MRQIRIYRANLEIFYVLFYVPEYVSLIIWWINVSFLIFLFFYTNKINQYQFKKKDADISDHFVILHNMFIVLYYYLIIRFYFVIKILIQFQLFLESVFTWQSLLLFLLSKYLSQKKNSTIVGVRNKKSKEINRKRN